MNVAFYTLGCKTNQFETQALQRLFVERGHTLVDFSAFADVYIVNTCTVTALSDKKSRNACRRARQRNPEARLIVCGCYAQLNPDEAAALCGADLVLGSSEKGRIVELAEAALPHAPAVPDLWQDKPTFEQLPPGGLVGGTRALLKVQDGCQNFCTYCRIPYARGPSRSLPLDAALAQAAALDAEGFAEMVITGIEISSYGLDLPGTPRLIDLIEGVCHAAPGVRVRLGSLELCPHFHLSLQSGCDATLRAMGRHYDSARYAHSCALLRAHMPLCAITTDLIVGFPGENADCFAQSLAFVEACAFSKVHIFPYSRRRGTRAATFPDQVPNAQKQERARRAAAVCEQSARAYLQSLIGQVLPVLFETAEGDGFVGHCPHYCTVFAAGRDLGGQVRPVRITACDDARLYGTVDV